MLIMKFIVVEKTSQILLHLIQHAAVHAIQSQKLTFYLNKSDKILDKTENETENETSSEISC